MAESKITTSALNSARTLNNISQKGILIKNVRRENSTLIFTVSDRAKSQTVNFLNSARVDCDVKDRKSVFNRIFSIWRFGIVLGIIFCVVLYSVLSSFVLKIEVFGTNESTAIKIEKYLKEINLTRGIPKDSLDLDKLDELLLKEFDFSVVESKIIGSTLSLTVKEELSKPDFYDATEINRIVASEDALITRVVCVQGLQSVTVGKSVKAGQTLIDSQKVVGESSIPIRAVGEIYGKVWREKEIYIPNEKIVYKPTGRTQKVYVMRIGGVSSKVKESPFEFYTLEKTSVKVGDFLPIFRDCYEYFEQVVAVEPNVEDNSVVIEKAKKEILLNSEQENAVLLDVWSEERLVEGGKYLKVIAEFEKRIDKYA